MATYEQRPGGAWRAKIRRKGYPSLSATFDTKAEAQRWAAEIEGGMSRARFVDMREAERKTFRHDFVPGRHIAAVNKGQRGKKMEFCSWPVVKLVG
ncbi:hypothetical protein ABOC32_13450 [Pseudomonas sp. WOUb67]|uniref:hypothetical protein n=1 Tax=Pseudomonas sp. WOUb67 TaxID=3161136 RepID=UPI003CF626D8